LPDWHSSLLRSRASQKAVDQSQSRPDAQAGNTFGGYGYSFSISLAKEKTMSRLTMLKAVKKVLLPGVFAALLAAVIGFHAVPVSAGAASPTWSIVAHFAYQDGLEYDYVVRTGVSTEDMPSFLAECGSSHWTGSVVRYHCFPRLE
jgi:hypothetical protein